MRSAFLYSISRSSILLVLLFSAAACSSKKADKFNSREGSFWDALFGDTSYQEIFDSRTQVERILSEFEPVLTAAITIWDSKLREAYVEEMRNQFRLSEEASQALAKEQLAEDETYFVFILSAATREPSWNDFPRKASMWRITLENGDESIQVDPERVEVIPQKDETLRYFYRRMDTFNLTYKVRFPKTLLRNASKIFFHISGARGALFSEFSNSSHEKSDVQK